VVYEEYERGAGKGGTRLLWAIRKVRMWESAGLKCSLGKIWISAGPVELGSVGALSRERDWALRRKRGK